MAISTIGTNGIENGSIVTADIAAGAVNLATQVTGVLPVANGGTGGTGATVSFKNRFINGNMLIWQRATTLTTSSNQVYGYADRWITNVGASTTYSQSTDVPSNAGFTYSVSCAGSAFNGIGQRIESNNCTDLIGQTITISFWAKRTSGSAGISINLAYANSTDNFSSTTQITETSVVASPSASWTRYSYTIGNLTSNIAKGLQVIIFNGSSGSDTTLYTGLQLELGTQATSFDFCSIGAQWQNCLRYYYQPGYALSPTITTDGSGRSLIAFPMPVFMRSAPSFSLVRFNTRGADGFIYYPNGNTTNTTSLTCLFAGITTDSSPAQSVSQFYNMPGGVSGYIIFGQDSTLKFSAEL